MSVPTPQRGQAIAEYIIVLALGVIVLIAVAAEPSVIQQILDAIKSFFKAFSYAISVAA